MASSQARFLLDALQQSKSLGESGSVQLGRCSSAASKAKVQARHRCVLCSVRITRATRLVGSGPKSASNLFGAKRQLAVRRGLVPSPPPQRCKSLGGVSSGSCRPPFFGNGPPVTPCPSPNLTLPERNARNQIHWLLRGNSMEQDYRKRHTSAL